MFALKLDFSQFPFGFLKLNSFAKWKANEALLRSCKTSIKCRGRIKFKFQKLVLVTGQRSCNLNKGNFLNFVALNLLG